MTEEQADRRFETCRGRAERHATYPTHGPIGGYTTSPVSCRTPGRTPSGHQMEEVHLKVKTHYVLENLEEETVYCVQVKAATEFIKGQMTDPICARTKNRDFSGKELAVVIGCVIIVCLVCSLVGYVIYRNNAVLKHLLYPPFRMPYHIQQFLDNVSDPTYEATINLDQDEEHSDGISIIESAVVVEVNQACDDPNLASAEKT